MIRSTQSRTLRTSLHSLQHGRPLASPFPCSLSAPSRRRLGPAVSATWDRPARFSSTASNASRPSTTLEPTAPLLSHTAANPPATTRPPPLDLPTREPGSSTFSHLFKTGKAYLTFYKTGLKYVYTNTRLVYAQDAATSLPRDRPGSPTDVAVPPRRTAGPPAASTRAALLLRQRWAHDIRRVPFFMLLLLVCGEFTPLVVLALPRTIPYTCRIPRQVDKLRRAAEERRAASFADLAARLAARGQEPGTASSPLVREHVSRSLGLVSPLWDRVGGVPAFLARARAGRRLAELAQDDALLRQSGGAPALEADEVRIACADRGVDVLGRTEGELRELLAAWLRLTRCSGAADADEELLWRMAVLLSRRPDEWPRNEGEFRRLSKE